MVERFNGRIEEVLRSHHFVSGEDLETTLQRFVWLYNHQLPQAALSGTTPMQAMKQWYRDKPKLFHKMPYDQPGLDNSIRREFEASWVRSSWSCGEESSTGFHYRESRDSDFHGNDTLQFLESTLHHLGDKTVGLLCADSGFFDEAILTALEGKRISYIIAARLTQPLQRTIYQATGWWALETGLELSALRYRESREATHEAPLPRGGRGWRRGTVHGRQQRLSSAGAAIGP